MTTRRAIARRPTTFRRYGVGEEGGGGGSRIRDDDRDEGGEHDEDDLENDDDDVVDGILVTRILRGEVPFPTAPTRGTKNRGDRDRLKYVPGTLDMDHAEALHYCYVNSTHYSGHLSDRPMSLVSLSDVHKLIYRNNPKSSSSSARHAMVSCCGAHNIRTFSMASGLSARQHAVIIAPSRGCSHAAKWPTPLNLLLSFLYFSILFHLLKIFARKRTNEQHNARIHSRTSSMDAITG